MRLGFLIQALRRNYKELEYNLHSSGLGTEAEKVEKLSPLFFFITRNLWICWYIRFYELMLEKYEY